jgi:cell fate regulator YaaT (PSP1 superfamily)
MPILPLPQFEADLEADRLAYQALKPPKTIVVRYGALKMVGEFPYDGDAKPGCGSRLVIRSPRGTEIGEMLTSTCPNSGCSKSVSRQEMLRYIENSGGRDYPFFTEGRVLRVATAEDMAEQSRLEQLKNTMRLEARRIAEELRLPMKVVDVEPILGGERLTVYFNAEERIDFREMVRHLGLLYQTRIEMRQVGARDEARITADYERCGQYCCCKNFLKVLKPVSMRSAKIQKATLDPLKISGRCGRLMCCLRYEDQTYDELRKRLPRRKQRVGTPEGDGVVLDTQILTQLVLVGLDNSDKQVAIAVEDLTEPQNAVAPSPPPMPPPRGPGQAPRPTRAPGPGQPSAPGQPTARLPQERPRRDDRPDRPRPQRPQPPRAAQPPDPAPPFDDFDDDIETDLGEPMASADPGPGPDSPDASHPGAPADPNAPPSGRRRRRRRRRRGGSGPEGGPPTAA